MLVRNSVYVQHQVHDSYDLLYRVYRVMHSRLRRISS